MTIDFKALAAKAVAAGTDMTKAATGGGNDYVPPAAGPGLCRFVGYVEIGKHKTSYKGQAKLTNMVQLVFELVGKRHPPQQMGDSLLPYRITMNLNLSLSEKAGFFKLFQRMNYNQEAQHMVELLGKGFKCEVFHDEWTDRKGNKRIDAQLRAPDGSYAVFAPRKEDEDSETGWVSIAVPEATSELRCFLWNYADKQQWDGLFIEGEYPERKDEKTGEVTAKARSKNVLQNKIKSAVNFGGSPLHILLLEQGGVDLSVPEDDEDGGAPTPSTPAAKPASPPWEGGTGPYGSDALGGIV